MIIIDVSLRKYKNIIPYLIKIIFSDIVFLIFYFRLSIKNKSTSFFGESTSIDQSQMSDDEFVKPPRGVDKWKKVNVRNTPTAGRGSIFRWKRKRGEPAETASVKRQKPVIIEVKNESAQDVIQVSSDDESESNISEDSVTGLASGGVTTNGVRNQNTPGTVFKNVSSKDNQPITIYDVDSPDVNSVKDESPETSSVKQESSNNSIFGDSLSAKLLKIFKNVDPPKSIDYKNPPGMPPVISGVPVKFPVSPYRSQISVMNAVSSLYIDF